MRQLARITIEGFKSIKSQSLKLGRLNVLIGGNGVGKSNLVGVFKFLRAIYDQNLLTYVSRSNGANALLHFGRKRTPNLSVVLEFSETESPLRNFYAIDLTPKEVAPVVRTANPDY